MDEATVVDCGRLLEPDELTVDDRGRGLIGVGAAINPLDNGTGSEPSADAKFCTCGGGSLHCWLFDTMANPTSTLSSTRSGHFTDAGHVLHGCASPGPAAMSAAGARFLAAASRYRFAQALNLATCGQYVSMWLVTAVSRSPPASKRSHATQRTEAEQASAEWSRPPHRVQHFSVP